MNNKWPLLAAGALLVVTVVVYGFLYVGGERDPRSPDELAKQALTAGKQDERDQAARDLADQGAAALPQLRRVLKESDGPTVRAAMIQALGAAYDFESMPRLLDCLDDPDPAVRQRAGVAVSTILGLDYHFQPDAAPAERAVTIKHYRSEYDKMLQNPPPKYRRN